MSLVSRLRGRRAPRALERKLSGRRSSDRMRLLLDISRLLAVPSIEVLMQRICEAARSLFGAAHARVYLHQGGRDELWSPDPAGELRIPISAGQAGYVLRTAQTLSVPGPWTDPARPAAPGAVPLRHLLCAPLRDVDLRVIGVLEVAGRAEGPFTPEDVHLAELMAEQAALAIQRYQLQAAALQAVEMRREMELAQQVQAGLVPARAPSIPNLQAVGWTRPASLTGGDCFDYWALDDGRMALLLGDASGHGLPAALVIAQVRTLLRALSEVNPEPEWLLERVNGRLNEDLAPSRFATAFLGCLSADGWLSWSSAGQGPICVRRAAGEPFELLLATAAPLAVAPDLIVTDPSQPLRLRPGGRLVILSDGVLEARNAAGELLGTGRVTELLDRLGHLDPPAILGHLRDAVLQWQGHDEPADDQTILVAGVM